MTSTVLDYRNRRADMLAYRPLLPPVRGRRQILVQELVKDGDGGVLIAGVQKLCQKILLVLLLRRGTRPYDIDSGCDFLTDAARGYWRTAADVEQSFYAARLDVQRQVQASETDDHPDDERWGSCEIGGITLSGTRVSFTLTILSAAGTSYTMITPLSVPVK